MIAKTGHASHAATRIPGDMAAFLQTRAVAGNRKLAGTVAGNGKFAPRCGDLRTRCRDNEFRCAGESIATRSVATRRSGPLQFVLRKRRWTFEAPRQRDSALIGLAANRFPLSPRGRGARGEGAAEI